MCFPPRSTVSLDLARSSSFGTIGVQCNGIKNRRGGTALAFVLYMAKLVKEPKERPFQAPLIAG